MLTTPEYIPAYTTNYINPVGETGATVLSSFREGTRSRRFLAFIEAQTSVFLATANGAGQPYIQHRGGPPGFLKVLDDQSLGFVDFVGNRQYISLGNLEENPKF